MSRSPVFRCSRHRLARASSRSVGAEPTERASDLVLAIEATVARRPLALAVVDANESLTYAELWERARKLASRLAALGVTHDSHVAICLDRGASEVVAMLATLLVSAAYVPLYLTHPAVRTRLILDDVSPAVLITDSISVASLDVPKGTIVLVLDRERDAIAACVPYEIPSSYDGERVAYALFTSGSTGRPKGVAVPRRALSSFLLFMAHTPGARRDGPAPRRDDDDVRHRGARDLPPPAGGDAADR